MPNSISAELRNTVNTASRTVYRGVAAPYSGAEVLRAFPNADISYRVDGKEYVYHFCGTQCYERWQQQSREAPEDERR